MKRQFMTLFFCMSVLFLCESCIVNYINTDTLKQNYEKKIHHTTLLGKLLFKTDKRKIDTYDHVQVFLNESEVGRDFEVTAYGSYTPLTLPIIRCGKLPVRHANSMPTGSSSTTRMISV